MGEIEKLGRNSPTGHTLYFLAVSDPGEIPDISLCSPNFCVLLLWDVTNLEPAKLVSVGRKLITAGGTYFCCWGPECETLHDAIDHAAPEFDDDETVIMTTWHSDEVLEDAIWFFLNSAFPHETFEETTKSMLAICVNNREWASKCRQALANSSEFSKNWLERDESAV